MNYAIHGREITMANDTALMDSGEVAAQGAVQAESAAGIQSPEPQTPEAAPQGTPAEGQEAGNIAEQLALLNKRVSDTETALKEKQRELHETTGMLKEAREAAQRNLGGNADPAAAQKQREEFLQRVDTNPRSAVEWFENVIAGQHQYIESVKKELAEQVAMLKDEADPIVQKNREVVDRLMSDPELKGLSRVQVARLAEKFRTPPASPAQRPPPAPTGAQRAVAPKPTPGALPPELVKMIQSRVGGKQDTSLI
jgi:hypothetical protein